MERFAHKSVYEWFIATIFCVRNSKPSKAFFYSFYAKITPYMYPFFCRSFISESKSLASSLITWIVIKRWAFPYYKWTLAASWWWHCTHCSPVQRSKIGNRKHWRSFCFPFSFGYRYLRCRWFKGCVSRPLVVNCKKLVTSYDHDHSDIKKPNSKI